jgi:hypothetical protein
VARTTKKRAQQLKHDKFRDTTFETYGRLSHRFEGKGRTILYAVAGAVALVAQAREMRSRRRIAAEEAARTAPVKMLFPLVVCFLPAFVILTVAPVVLSALRSFKAR